jgi:hypothetical protein
VASAKETAKARATESEKELVGKFGFVRKREAVNGTQEAGGRRQKVE